MADEKAPGVGIPPLSTPPHEEERENEVKAESSDSTSVEINEEKQRFARIRSNSFAKKLWNIVTWTPKRCRWDPEAPPKFSMALNLLFAFVSGLAFICNEAASVVFRVG
jgi:hypothetical protein